MSLCLSHYSQQQPEAMLRGAAEAARGVTANEWELGAWLLAIEHTRAYQSAGFRSTVAFAIVRLDIEPAKASNLLRIMRVLEHLPDLSRAFHRGELGYAKVREITRVATPGTELAWLEFARTHTTDQVRQRVVCSPAAFERRVRSVRNQADSLLITHAQRKFVSGPPGRVVDAPELPGGLRGVVEDAAIPAVQSLGRSEPQPGLFGPSFCPRTGLPGLSGPGVELPADGSGQTRIHSESDGPGGLSGSGAELPANGSGQTRIHSESDGPGGLSGSGAELPAGGSGQTRIHSESDGPGGLKGPGDELAAGGPRHTRKRLDQVGPGDGSAASGADVPGHPDDCPGVTRCAELRSGEPFGQPVPGCLLAGSLLEEDGLPAPQRVRLVVELSAEEYAEWGAIVGRLSSQFGRKVSSREVILELARRHVASTGGNSLQRNPVVVRLEPDGAGFVQTDRGPLAVSRQSSEDYLARATSVVVQGSQPATTSVLLLGGRRRKKLPADVVRSVVARAGGCCESCGQHGILHVHHIRALSRGGSNALENLRLLCSACHGREHASDFQSGGSWERARARRQRISAQKRSAPSSRGRPARPTGSDP